MSQTVCQPQRHPVSKAPSWVSVLSVIILTVSTATVAQAQRGLYGQWYIVGFDSQSAIIGFDGLPRRGAVEASEQFTSTPVNVSKSGPVGSWRASQTAAEWTFIPTGGLPGYSMTAKQSVAASGSAFGDTGASAFAENDSSYSAAFNHQGLGTVVEANIQVSFYDSFSYMFRPTLVRPAPGPMVLNFALTGGLDLIAEDLSETRRLSRSEVVVALSGSDVYYLDELQNEIHHDVFFSRELSSDQMYQELVSEDGSGGPFYGRFSKSLEINKALKMFVNPTYEPSADGRTPYPVSYDFNSYISVVSEAVAGRASADLNHTLRFESITFSDGTTPESQGYELVFDSGNTSPNLRPVPEPSAVVLALLGIGFAGRWRRPSAR